MNTTLTRRPSCPVERFGRLASKRITARAGGYFHECFHQGLCFHDLTQQRPRAVSIRLQPKRLAIRVAAVEAPSEVAATEPRPPPAAAKKAAAKEAGPTHWQVVLDELGE